MTGQRDVIHSEIVPFVRSLDQDDRHAPATLLYNESWLLRLVLRAEARGIRCLPEPFEPGARWFTEARLYTLFKARKRGDGLAESHTHVFLRQDPAEQRRLLKSLLSNCTLSGGTLCPTYKKPFDVLVRGNETGDWLGVWDGIRNYLITAA